MKDFLGIDIGSLSVKVVALSKKEDGLELRAIGEAKTGGINLVKATKEELKKLAKIIKSLLVDMGLKDKMAVISLPESEVISRLIKLPPLNKKEIKDALRFEAETFVPYPLKEVTIDYEVVEKDELGKLLVFAIAAKNELIHKFLKLFKMVGLELLAMESVSVAIKRVISQVISKNNSILLVDIGNSYSSVICLNNSQIYYTGTIAVGGESISRSISINLSLDMSSAEEYKKAYGMNASELEGKIKNAILPVFNNMVEELRKTMTSYREEWGKKVDLLVLSGGGANMPGLAEELTKVLGIEVQIIQPFLRIDSKNLTLPMDINIDGCRFSVSVGLAMRGLV